MEFDVIGIGNSLMQMVVTVDDYILNELSIKKGSMNLVDSQTIQRVIRRVSSLNPTFEPSGDVANTMMGIAALGGKAAYIGKVGIDANGSIYESMIQEEEVYTNLAKSSEADTGMVISLVTSDSERTMVTYLGAAMKLSKEDINIEMIKSAKVLYLSSYVIEDDTLFEAAKFAMDLAKKYQVKIAFDTADAGTITRVSQRIQTVITDYVDIIFANEHESSTLTRLAPEDAHKELLKITDIAIVKVGKQGSFIATHTESHVVPAVPVTAIDTTGAGDLYASGFLYGYTQGFPLKKCGDIGNAMGARIVQQSGSKLNVKNKQEVKKMTQENQTENIPPYEVKDIKLAEQGMLNLEWAEKEMGALMKIKERFTKEKPLQGIRIGLALHVTKETGVLLRTLIAGGAEIAITGCNPLSTQDDIAAALAKEGVKVWAYKGETNEDYYRFLNYIIAFKPHITIDDGCDLVSEIHKKHPDLIPTIIGGCEETTTGIIRLKAMLKDKALKYPVIAVNDNNTKHLLDNYIGTAQSTLDGVIRATNVLLAGKNIVVVGYGDCGKGVAKKAAGMGSNVIVTEVNAFRALQARMDGFRVMPMNDASILGDVFITVTGNKHVVSLDHMRKMKDGAILANSGHFDNEIDVNGLKKSASKTRKIRAFMDEFILDDKKIFVLGEGRLVNLSAAEGHPSAVMSTSFCGQALSCEYLVKNKGKMPVDVIELPAEVDDDISKLQLNAMGIKIDTLTEEQKKYLESWEEGT